MSEPIKKMKTIWFCGEDEEKLISIAEVVGEELINRDQFIELIVHNEIQEVLGRGLKDTNEDKSIFVNRLGFLGHLLHRNNIFALIVSKDAPIDDRKKVKENYKNYIQVNIGTKDTLCDIELNTKDDHRYSGKKIVEYLIKQKLVPEQGASVYSKDEEEEIRRRLEELGYV